MNDWPLMMEDRSTFMALDRSTRRLVLALLGAFGPPTEADHEALQRHPNGRMLATWLLELPAFAGIDDDIVED